MAYKSIKDVERGRTKKTERSIKARPKDIKRSKGPSSKEIMEAYDAILPSAIKAEKRKQTIPVPSLRVVAGAHYLKGALESAKAKAKALSRGKAGEIAEREAKTAAKAIVKESGVNRYDVLKGKYYEQKSYKNKSYLKDYNPRGAPRKVKD